MEIREIETYDQFTSFLDDLSKTYTKGVINQSYRRASEKHPELFKKFDAYGEKLDKIMKEIIASVNEDGFVDDAPTEDDSADDQIDLFN